MKTNDDIIKTNRYEGSLEGDTETNHRECVRDSDGSHGCLCGIYFKDEESILLHIKNPKIYTERELNSARASQLAEDINLVKNKDCKINSQTFINYFSEGQRRVVIKARELLQIELIEALQALQQQAKPSDKGMTENNKED